MKTSLLLYDIPSRVTFDNPSGFLRRRALRINYSCWVIDREHVPWPLLDSMTQAEVNWHLIEFEESATETILKLAASQMLAELEANRRREAESLERLDTELAQAEANGTSGERVRARHAKRRADVLKRTSRPVEDLEAAASEFGLRDTMLTDFFGQTMHRVAMIRGLNGARAAVYAELGRVVRHPGLRQAAASGSVPAEVLADTVEEQGEVSALQMSGNAILASAARQAFGAQTAEATREPGEQEVPSIDGSPLFPSNRFIYHAGLQTFAAEASDLFAGRQGFPASIRIRSGRTGAVMVFERREAVRNRENDLELVRYLAANGLKVEIFND